MRGLKFGVLRFLEICTATPVGGFTPPAEATGPDVSRTDFVFCMTAGMRGRIDDGETPVARLA